MQSFIQEVAQKIYATHSGQLDKVEVVFPNRRAGLFFRKELGALIDQPVWMPSITSLEDFILFRSGFRKLDTLEAVFLLYEVYKKHQSREETFDNFFFWGEMILRDFEEIDHYQVNADNLFTSIKSQKELDEQFYFLDEEEKRIIQSFWRTFLPEASKSQEQFLATWKLLKPIYHEFRQMLIDKRLGYGGLIYQQFLAAIEEKKVFFDKQIYLAGFNALTMSEEGIIKNLVENGARMIWDVDAYYLKDPKQEAGVFLRQYAADPTLKSTFPDIVPAKIKDLKKIEATGVSLEVGQAKAMAEHLRALISRQDFVPNETVIVLPNEYMLFPVLHSLPESITDVNITMGYPLKDTPVFSLLESLLILQSSKRSSVVHGFSYYHKPVTEVLEHPLVRPIAGKQAIAFVADVKKRNLIFIYQDELPADKEVLATLFQEPEDPFLYLQQVLQMLHDKWSDRGHDLELEFISRYYQHIDKLRELMGDRSEGLGYDFLIRLFRRFARSLKVPFTGEPLQGLQIMGVLETRNLDFKNVFILNMNEDSWPATPKRGSFIPYNVRKAFELPVFEHQDAIYAYLFYRLLQRAENVQVYYNTVSEFNVNGEISRFIQQLAFESTIEIKKNILANPIEIDPPKDILIQKDADVMSRLERYLVKENEWTPRLTPSALDTYLYCRLRFYFKYVEQLYEPEELQEELGPMVFGNILHDTMEILYANLIKKQKRDIVDPNDFFGLEADIDGAVNRAFIQHYNVKNEKKFKLEGRNVIAAEIIKKTARQILKVDQKYAPFKILGLETSTKDGYVVDFPINVNGTTLEVGIKGKIDRLDLKEGTVRVIDYKTGKDSREFVTLESLIDREDEKRNKAAFQVFFYSYLFYKTYKGNYDRIEPGLFNSRDLFETDFQWQIVEKPGRKAQQVFEFRDYLESFEETISKLLGELFDPAIPFDQVTDVKKCRWCPYSGICGRS